MSVGLRTYAPSLFPQHPAYASRVFSRVFPILDPGMQPPSTAAFDRTTTVSLAHARDRLHRSCAAAVRLVRVFGACGAATVVYAASLPSPSAFAAQNTSLALSAGLTGAHLWCLTETLQVGADADARRAIWLGRLDTVTGRLYEAASCLGGLVVIALSRTRSVLSLPTLPLWQCAVAGLVIGGPLVLAVRTTTVELEDALREERALSAQ